MNVYFRLILISIFLFTVAACSAPATPDPTATALPPTETPLPTATAIPPSATPQPTATATFTPPPTATPDHKATETAIAQATQAALSVEVKKELEELGLPTEGSLAWVGKSPESITLTQYAQTEYSLIDSEEFANFVMKVDVGWSSASGLAGCSIYFRSSGKSLERAFTYEFATLRLSGAPAWDFQYLENGRFVHSITGKPKFNNAIDVAQDAVNTYVVVADGDTLTVYANGIRMGSGTSTKRESGVISWGAFQESGETTCTFDNAWVWRLP